MPTSEIDKVEKGSCGGCSQIFIAINPYVFGTEEDIDGILERTINQLNSAEHIERGGKVTYSCQRTAQTRENHNINGIIADESMRKEVCSF